MRNLYREELLKWEPEGDCPGYLPLDRGSPRNRHKGPFLLLVLRARPTGSAVAGARGDGVAQEARSARAHHPHEPTALAAQRETGRRIPVHGLGTGKDSSTSPQR